MFSLVFGAVRGQDALPGPIQSDPCSPCSVVMRMIKPLSVLCKIKVAPLKGVRASLEARGGGCPRVGLVGEEK